MVLVEKPQFENHLSIPIIQDFNTDTGIPAYLQSKSDFLGCFFSRNVYNSAVEKIRILKDI